MLAFNFTILEERWPFPSGPVPFYTTIRTLLALIATGINNEGYREILGMMVGDSESESTWSEFFSSLKDRGLSGVDLVVSDDHKGLVNAVQKHFQGAGWQRCQTHFTRNILEACPKSVMPQLHARLRPMFDAPDLETAKALYHSILREFENKAPKAMAILEEGFEDAMAVIALPAQYRKRLCTANGAERLNQEVRRQERVIRIFPNEASALRLIGAVFVEQDKAWSTGHKYLKMDEYWEWKQAAQENAKQTAAPGNQAA